MGLCDLGRRGKQEQAFHLDQAATRSIHPSGVGSSCLQLEVSDLLEGDVVKVPRETNVPELMENMMLIGSSQVDCGSRT